MYDREKIVALSEHPVRHIPKFGGMGVSLCGVLSYSWQREKPLCAECAKIKKQLKERTK